MTEAFNASDLTVVIPTIGRSAILSQTLDALRAQSVSGFDVVVVLDGLDLPEPTVSGNVRVLRKEHGGPGAARNAAVAAVETKLVLFLGDDMIPQPGVVDAHLALHNREPDDAVTVLGHVRWHPSVADVPANQWIDRSGTQFDFANIVDEDAGFGRFYSCNVSLKRDFFLRVGGFDEAFVFDYEDLDFGWRAGQNEMRLLYARDAVVDHLHRYDLGGLQRRWASRGAAERQFAKKHSWFQPWFEPRARAADRSPVSELWHHAYPRFAPLFVGGLQRRAVDHVDQWYLQQVAPYFLNAWEADRGVDELREYLGDEFDPRLLAEHRERVDEEEESSADELTFYRTSSAYLYDLTAFAGWPTKVPYRRDLRRLVAPGARLLDYGSGIGSDGLQLLQAGYRVDFADFDNPSAAYLKWRLAQRGHAEACVFDVEKEVPGGYDLAYSFDVIEHVDDPFDFLARLEQRAGIVFVNLLEPDPEDTHLHKPLPIPEILEHAKRRGLLHYRLYHDGRSHLLGYSSSAMSPARRWAVNARRAAKRRIGALVA